MTPMPSACMAVAALVNLGLASIARVTIALVNCLDGLDPRAQLSMDF